MSLPFNSNAQVSSMSMKMPLPFNSNAQVSCVSVKMPLPFNNNVQVSGISIKCPYLSTIAIPMSAVCSVKVSTSLIKCPCLYSPVHPSIKVPLSLLSSAPMIKCRCLSVAMPKSPGLLSQGPCLPAMPKSCILVKITYILWQRQPLQSDIIPATNQIGTTSPLCLSDIS